MPIIDEEHCFGCGACVPVCPGHAISLVNDVVSIDPAKCEECGSCIEACPYGALLPAPPAAARSLTVFQPVEVKGHDQKATTFSTPYPIAGELDSKPGLLTRLARGLLPVACDFAVDLADRWLSSQTGAQGRANAANRPAPIGESTGRRGGLRRRQRQGRGKRR